MITAKVSVMGSALILIVVAAICKKGSIYFLTKVFLFYIIIKDYSLLINWDKSSLGFKTAIL